LSVQENSRELTACGVAGKPKPSGANLADEHAGSGKRGFKRFLREALVAAIIIGAAGAAVWLY
jgi:hypothetical protein